MKIQKQPDGFTCGITTVSVTASFFNKKEITLAALLVEVRSGVRHERSPVCRAIDG